MARARWLLLVALLIAPLAGASATGSFRFEGDARLPGGAESSFVPLLLYQDDTTRVHGFRLQASRVVLHEFEDRSVDVEVAGVSPVETVVSPEPRRSTAVLHDAEVVFGDASERGYLGFYPGEDAWAAFTSLSASSLRAQPSAMVESHLSEGDEERPLESLRHYRRSVDEPHVWMEGAGLLAYDGTGFLKLVGPDLVVTSREGSRTVVTGEVRVSPAETVFRWVVLEMMPANLTMEAVSPWMMAGPAMHLRWEGESRFTPASGSLTTWEGSYAAAGSPVVLAGRFAARVQPEVAEGRAEVRMDLSGDMDRTNLRLQSAPLAQKVVDDPMFLRASLLLVGVAVGLGGSFAAGVWLSRRRRAQAQVQPELPFSVDDCMAAATGAADDEDWPRAAEWLQRVRRLAPTSARSCADLAHAFFQMGQREEALALYEEASRLSQDGEADFNGAVVAIEAGRSLEEIERWIERALARTPAYVVDVESDPVFGPLRTRARFERIVSDAWSRVDDIDDGASVSRGL